MSPPALLIAGTQSGCGKTTVTLGIMAALARRGLMVQPFKCGPDFIDPSLHKMVTGRVSRNLDVRMCGADFVRRTFARHSSATGCSVVEGVMGLFDGGGLNRHSGQNPGPAGDSGDRCPLGGGERYRRGSWLCHP